MLVKEMLLYMMVKAAKEEAKKGISLYLSHLQGIRFSITGRNHAQPGIKPCLLYGMIMGQMLWAKIDGLVKTREEEQEFAKGVMGKGTGL